MTILFEIAFSLLIASMFMYLIVDICKFVYQDIQTFKQIKAEKALLRATHKILSGDYDTSEPTTTRRR